VIYSPSRLQRAAASKKVTFPKHSKAPSGDFRFRAAAVMILLLGVVISFRLVTLMIFDHGSYKKLAFGAQEVSSELIAKRGEIFLQDTRNGKKYPIAVNRDYFLLFADSREIPNFETATSVTKTLGDIFKYDNEKREKVFNQLSKRTDPYEPIEDKIEEVQMNQIKAMQLPGVHFTRKPFRFYPENNLAASVVGFVGKDDKGLPKGSYGIEGYFQKELSGEAGFVEGARSAGGRLIVLSGIKLQESKDGANFTLTVDRTLQFEACKRLSQGMTEYGASSAALVIMDPLSGAIRAMCSFPDFNPNEYSKVESGEAYNNTSIFTPYEPGSIFKPITMAAALNEDLVNPNSPFYDSGVREGVCSKPIRNAENKAYQDTNMIGVLENSINTGMIYIAEQLGTKRFREYVEQFGFGVKSGVELNTENSGTIDSLSQNKKQSIDCYTATGSFGQGITVTPLQMVAAYAAIANGGHLMKPYIVDTVEYSDGKVVKTEPQEIRQVLTSKSASLLSGMLVNVVENGHAKLARSESHYIGGKTGTAQIPGRGGYSEDTIHSFVGFGPVGDPKYVMIIKYEKPQRKYAESTAVPVYGDISKFILDYYQVPPNRK